MIFNKIKNWFHWEKNKTFPIKTLIFINKTNNFPQKFHQEVGYVKINNRMDGNRLKNVKYIDISYNVSYIFNPFYQKKTPAYTMGILCMNPFERRYMDFPLDYQLK